jgi:diguanylate cyclase (GGDEF)-like protein/PAS domain S-box-containing protein
VLAPSDPTADILKVLALIRAGEPIAAIETLRKAKDGRLVDVVLTISPVKDETGRVTGASTIARDVTEQRRLRRERDRFFDLSLDLVCVAGTDGYFKQLNPKFEMVLGFTRAELLERPFLDFVHPDEREATLKTVEKLSSGEPAIDFENRYRCKDSSYKWLSWHASPEPDGTIYAVARDVTETKIAQQKLAALAESLRTLAIVDELTGLHNRRGFNILADQELTRVRRKREKGLFFFADVDGLKQINDKLGHDVGDRAICGAAAVLRSAFRKSDIIARLGGDEFVVLCTDGAPDDRLLAERLEQLLRGYNSSMPLQPFALAISIGSTTSDPDQQEPIDAILKRADKMMYEQKARRKAAARSVSKIPAPAGNTSETAK